MKFEMKPEKEVLDLISNKNQCNSVNSPHNIKKKKKKKKKKKSVMTCRRKKKSDSPANNTTAIRRLFNTCKEVFCNNGPGIIPSEDKIIQLQEFLDNMRPEDVGLTPTMSYFRQNTRPVNRFLPPVTYLCLHECDQFTIAILCLPPNSVIPLHNHPGMTVFSKLLFGSMHIKSYDWVANAPMRDSKTRLAKLKMDSTFTSPCKPSILYPEDGGNMHRFTAKTACAVLDVIGPPYSNSEGRHCSYFLDFPFEKYSENDDVLRGEEKGYAWLQERDDNIEDRNVVGALYKGPKVED